LVNDWIYMRWKGPTHLHCVLGNVQWTSAIAGVRLRSLPVMGPPINVHVYVIIVLCSVS
jgi:hypothetical protein